MTLGERQVRPEKQQLERELLEHLAEALEEDDGWRVSLDDAANHRVDALADRQADRIALVLKVRRDARRQLLRPMLAEAMLAASAATAARQDSRTWRPVAVVGAPRLTDEMVAHLRSDFEELKAGLLGRSAADIGWGVVDGTGRVLLEGRGLEVSRAPSPGGGPRPPRVPEPFTDRGQWVLKLLLAPLLPAWSLGCPPGARFPSANALARAAEVSVSTAANVVRYLREQGHLVEVDGSLELRRLPELLLLWKQRSPRPSASLEADFLLPTADPAKRLHEGLLRLRGHRAHAAQAFLPPVESGMAVKQPRACLSGIAACRALGVSVVEGAVPSLHVDDLSPRLLEALGLRAAAAGSTGAVRLQVPSAPEAVFRAAVNHQGVACADLLQCWLDMTPGTPRHGEQARELETGPLAAVLGAEAA